MKSTGLVIAAALLLLLAGLIWWSNKKEAANTKQSDTGAPPKILSLDSAAVSSFTIQHHNQDRLTVARSRVSGFVLTNPDVKNDSWQITAPTPLAADQEAVSSLLSALSSLSSEHLVEDKAGDLTPYGLAAPELELTVTLKDNKTHKLLIGDQTPAGNAYYAMVAGDPRVFTLASYNKSSFDKTPGDLRDKRLLTADFDKVSQIDLVSQKAGKKQNIIFARSKDSWQILKPLPARADSSQVEQLISTLREAKMDTSASDEATKTVAAFKTASPFAAAKITGAAGTQDLEIRKAKDDYYAKSSVTSGIYKIAAGTATGLDKSLDDFRNKKLFDFGYQDPDKIEIHDGAKSYFFTHSGSDWWGPDGKKLDSSSLDSVVEKIRGLTATKFPAAGFTVRVLQLVVTSNAGKRVERVSFAKQADTFIARREDEPALYEVPAKDVQDLQESVTQVKPFVAPNPPPNK